MKKGVSPIIATVLIIGFVIVLASVLTLWGIPFAKKQTQDVERDVVGIGLIGSVDLELKSVEILPNRRARLTIENKGKTEIGGVYARFFATNKEVDTVSTGGSIPAYSIKDFTINYDSSLNEITKVEIFPQLITVEKESISIPSISDSQYVPLQKACISPTDCGEGKACCKGSCVTIECIDDSICNGGTCENPDDLLNPCYAYCYNGEGIMPPLCVDDDQDTYNFTGGDCGPIDCDDNNPSIFPGVPEACNGEDDNCDGQVDEGYDEDNDGFTTCGGDCNDANPAVKPTATETCDSIDNDCDGLTDEGGVCGGGGGGDKISKKLR